MYASSIPSTPDSSSPMMAVGPYVTASSSVSGLATRVSVLARKRRRLPLRRSWMKPACARRSAAKDDLHGGARERREEGWSVNDIALELGVARSTAWQWVRHLPLDRDSERAKRKREHAKLMTDAQRQRRREERALLGATIKG